VLAWLVYTATYGGYSDRLYKVYQPSILSLDLATQFFQRSISISLSEGHNCLNQRIITTAPLSLLRLLEPLQFGPDQAEDLGHIILLSIRLLSTIHRGLRLLRVSVAVLQSGH